MTAPARSDADGASPPVAVITGGGTGIGAATAVELSTQGYRVAICGRRSDKLERVAAQSGAYPFVTDLTDPAQSAAFIEEVTDAFGRVDTIILNAGTAVEAPFETLDDDDWSHSLAVNLQSAVRLVRLALPLLTQSRGSIVGVASIAALRAGSSMSAYSASKAGLVSLMQSLAVEYAPLGLRSNAVCPGWVRTEMADHELSGVMAEHDLTLDEAYSRVTSFVPAHRAADPVEIARVIAFLASPAASYVTGVALPVDGGATIADVGTMRM